MIAITKEQLWTAVRKGWPDTVIAGHAGRSAKTIKKLRRQFGVPSAVDLGTYISGRSVPTEGGEHEAAQSPVGRPTQWMEDQWCARLKGRRFEDHPKATRGRGRVGRPATIVLSQSSAATLTV